ASTPIDDEVRHLRLHVEVAMRLAHAALPAMLERGSGRIVNVASVAGFVPRGTYGAAKGWLISFSRWANVAYGPRGVTVTAVCPGFVHTDFHARLG
ncbi:SDR family NAD(P)-dependent oxidoreductase, partial [Klebsiella pneumoniae]